MSLDIQKAMIWKRISAFLFDVIFLGIAAVGFAFGLSALLHYDDHNDTLSQCYVHYEQEFSVTFDISQEEFLAMSPQQQQNYENAYAAMMGDEQAMHAYSMVINLTLTITTVSILLAYLVLEFGVPLALKNGQTLGKKVFGLGVMRTDGIKINAVILFVRSVLGKYAVETMIPVLVTMMTFFGMMGLPGTILMMVLGLAQIVLVCATRNNSLIHDLLSNTVVVDLPSQMIFETQEEKIAYQEKCSAEQAANQKA